MLTLLFTLSALIFLIFPESVSGWVDSALLAVKNVVIATLFPMMVMTRMIDFSFLSKFLLKRKIWKRLSISDSLIDTVIRGIISGFPVAAIEVEEKVSKKEISALEGEKALALASIPSPAFVIAVAGENFLHGLAFYLLSLSVTYITVIKTKSEKSISHPSAKRLSFVKALSSGVTASLTVSANILFFNFLASLFSFLPEKLTLLFSAVAELGFGTVALSSHPLLKSFLVGWGGISALSQVSASSPSVSKKLYVKARILSGAALLLLSLFLKTT